MTDPRADLAGVRVTIAFVFATDFESAQRLAKEMERRTDARLVYMKTSVSRLKIVSDPDPPCPVHLSVLHENDSDGRPWPG
jgi:hypothetical protein